MSAKKLLKGRDYDPYETVRNHCPKQFKNKAFVNEMPKAELKVEYVFGFGLQKNSILFTSE
jgi:hypothetical protein